ncbi:MAG: NYN domain-containing protein [Patescibacteria group bacterium UBA2163]
MQKDRRNIAFIDGQNLHLGTTEHPTNPWQIDLARFRIYLQKKYAVEEAYYWLGFVDAANDELYDAIQKAGFIVKFRKHNPAMKSIKKGNVDTEIVFACMHRLYKKDDFNKVVLVSGDGDYFRMVKFLLEEERLEKVLFPNSNASSLYKKITRRYFDDLSKGDIREKIGKRKGGLR